MKFSSKVDQTGNDWMKMRDSNVQGSWGHQGKPEWEKEEEEETWEESETCVKVARVCVFVFNMSLWILIN